MEKKFVALRVLFAADPASVNLTDLRKMKRFAENNLQELQGWNDGQKLNGDYAIEGWVHYLENVLKDINKELGRRMELVGNPKTTFEELKDLSHHTPSPLSDEDLHLFKYMLENQALVLGNSQSDGISQSSIKAFNEMAEDLLERIDLEFEQRKGKK